MLLLLLVCVFCKELYSVEYSMCSCMSSLSLSFIGAIQLGFHATFTLSVIAVLSEYDDNLTLSEWLALSAPSRLALFILPSAKHAWPVERLCRARHLMWMYVYMILMMSKKNLTRLLQMISICFKNNSRLLQQTKPCFKIH